MMIDFTVEPINSTANANGNWVLWCLPDPVQAIPASTTVALEAEGSNPYIWACGVWSASNENPYCSGTIRLNTSRNCQHDARLVLSIRVEGISAGNAQVNRSMCYFTKSL